MALPATDNFNRANANPIGGDWTTVTGAYAQKIVSNQLLPTTDYQHNHSYWNADSFENNQYSQVVMVTIPSTRDAGPSVRVASGAATYYSVMISQNELAARKTVAGVETTLGSIVSRANANNSIYRIAVSGITLTVTVDGVDQFTRDDATIPSGAAGMWIYRNIAVFDDWGGGNVGAAGGLSISVAMAAYRQRWR